VKTARLRGIFLVQSGTIRSFTEQSSGSFTTQLDQAGLFLETIITSVLTRKKLSNCEYPAHNLSNPELWEARPPSVARCCKRRANQAGFWQFVKYRFLL
jgi:hypothetical protein